MKPKFQNKGASHPMNRQIALIVLFTLPLAPLLLAQTGSTGAVTVTVTDPAGSLVSLDVRAAPRDLVGNCVFGSGDIQLAPWVSVALSAWSTLALWANGCSIVRASMMCK